MRDNSPMDWNKAKASSTTRMAVSISESGIRISSMVKEPIKSLISKKNMKGNGWMGRSMGKEYLLTFLAISMKASSKTTWEMDRGKFRMVTEALILENLKKIWLMALAHSSTPIKTNISGGLLTVGNTGRGNISLQKVQSSVDIGKMTVKFRGTLNYLTGMSSKASLRTIIVTRGGIFITMVTNMRVNGMMI